MPDCSEEETAVAVAETAKNVVEVVHNQNLMAAQVSGAMLQQKCQDLEAAQQALTECQAGP